MWPWSSPGVTLAELDAALVPHGLIYPVFPGEQSASLGGNVATNAGGMRAVKYGVTRHHVLGLEAVLGTGEVITTGGKFVKSTSGYDLTQLIIGSEGTLALVTRATLRLHPRPDHQATLLAPFATIERIAAAVPPIVASGVGPLMVEYIDLVTMAGITANAGIDLGIPDDIKERALAYLVVVLEDHHDDRLEEDTEALADLMPSLGALDVYVLPDHAGTQLIAAREQAFWVSKANGADDIVDVVVPRASIPAYLAAVGDLAAATSSLVVGCGHAGDGNVHLSVWQSDPDVRQRLVHDIIAAGVALGGAISGEHGIGTLKRPYMAELEDPAKLDLMRRIKAAFDPARHPQPGHHLRPGRASRRHRPVNGAQALIRTLVDRGVDTCFMNPGTSEMHFVAALDDVTDMRGVLALFEGVATGAADGYARMAGRPAATLLHLGPGPRQRPGQSAQRPPGPQPGGQHRGRPRHLPTSPTTPSSSRTSRPWPATSRHSSAPRSRRRGRRRRGRRRGRRLRSARARWPPSSCPPTSRGPRVARSTGAGPPAAPAPGPRPRRAAVEAAAAALRSGEPAALLIGGRACSGEPWTRWPTSPPPPGPDCSARPSPLDSSAVPGRPPVDRLAYLAEFAALQLEGLRHLVLVDAVSPVSFFAYPGKAEPSPSG